MRTSKNYKKMVATAIAIPMAASLVAIPNATAQQATANEETIELNIRTTGIAAGSEITLLSGKGEELDKKKVNSNSALRFTYDNDITKNGFVTIQVDGERFTPSEGQCFGENLKGNDFVEEQEVTSTVETTELGIPKEEQVDTDNPEENIGDITDEENSEEPSDEKTEEDSSTTTSTDKPSEPTSEKKDDEKPSATPTDKKEDGKEDSSKTSEAEPTSDKKDEEKPSESPTTTTKANTDGSNTPVSDPMALVIKRDNNVVSKINYVEMKDGTVHVLGDYTEKDLNNLKEAIKATPMAGEGLLGQAVGGGGGESALKAAEKLKDVNPDILTKIERLFKSPMGNWLKEHGDKIQNSMDIIVPLAKVGEIAYEGARAAGKVPPELQSMIDSSPLPLGDTLEAIKTLSNVLSTTVTINDLAHLVIDGVLNGGMIKIDPDAFGNIGDLVDIGGDISMDVEEQKKTQDEINDEYYAGLNRHDKDQGAVNDAIAELVANMKDGYKMVLDVFDDAYDLRNATSYDKVTCVLGFDPEAGKTNTNGDKINVSLDDENSKDDSFDADKYFAKLDNDVEEDTKPEITTTVSRSSQKSNTTQQEQQNVSPSAQPSAAPVINSGSPAPVVQTPAQNPVVAQPVKKIAGPSVETGGAVEVRFIDKIRNLFNF